MNIALPRRLSANKARAVDTRVKRRTSIALALAEDLFWATLRAAVVVVIG